MLIYKILTTEQWSDLQAAGETQGAPIDVADGYVHFSTAVQAAETAAKHFADQDGLWVLALEADASGDALRWEISRGDQLFPHLHGPLRMADVIWAKPLPLGPDGHQFPGEMA